jgi:DNA modification methylase
MPVRIENPKRFVSSNKSTAGWVDYYAGYSNGFAKTLLESSDLPAQAVVVDPWNGSGTTTEVASILGFKGHGYDVNPVMLIVAKARMLSRPTKPSIIPLMNRILASAKSQAISVSSNDPLDSWFLSNGIGAIRAIESSIQELLVDSDGYVALHELDTPEKLSDLGAFFYNALFRSVRQSLLGFYSSNPTWIRKAKTEEQKIRLSLTSLGLEFRRQVSGMLQSLEDVPYCHLDADYVLGVATSDDIPIKDRSADIILSSPPYCTRIDYAIATLPELAILGYSKEKLRALRDQMIGTSTISKMQPAPSEEWGKTCNKLLKRIKDHTSKASATYYHKNHLQYFDGMFASLGECQRILKPGSNCVLVVQDSYYKDVHNDLPKIITEMAEVNGLSISKRRNFKQSRTLAGVNPGTKAYRQTFGATEAVLWFKAT